MQRKNPALPALEKNILKFRALQTVLLLHHVEALKSYVFGSIAASERIFDREGARKMDKPVSKRAWDQLVELEVLTRAESDDLQNIIKIRNDIGHRVHDLFADISGRKLKLVGDYQYDYKALMRLSVYRRKIESGMGKHFIQEIGFRELIFEEAELTMQEELKRLDRRITKQLGVRQAQIAQQKGCMPSNSFKPTPLRGAA